MLAAEGAKVVLAARRQDELERLANGIRQAGGVAVPVVIDLTSDESIARLLATAEAVVARSTSSSTTLVMRCGSRWR
jgi:NADP-dependent 3-hydroxy acid dehydrogenase YdfG